MARDPERGKPFLTGDWYRSDVRPHELVVQVGIAVYTALAAKMVSYVLQYFSTTCFRRAGFKVRPFSCGIISYVGLHWGGRREVELKF